MKTFCGILWEGVRKEIQMIFFGFFDLLLDTLKGKPSLTERSPSTVRASDSNFIDLSCSVDALPDPAWTWQSPSGNVISMGDSTLQISNSLDQQKSTLKFKASSEHYGQYKCTASNKHGEAEWTMNVLKIEQPKNPVVEALASFPTKARLFIKNYVKSNEDGVESIAENERPTQVKITFYPKGIDGAADQAEPILEDFNPSGIYEIYKLRPRLPYVIIVQGKNEGGDSEPVQIEYETSEPQAPSSPAFITTNMTECLTSSCTVQWTIPDNSGEPITGYKVMYKPIKVVMDQSPISGTTRNLLALLEYLNLGI
uniref:Uncharacterized protein n=1 Tax=Romanomermis culicivorax TaxID=13658 RepID=A0A915HQE0_ROMCU